jgi:hypothetical protein
MAANPDHTLLMWVTGARAATRAPEIADLSGRVMCDADKT